MWKHIQQQIQIDIFVSVNTFYCDFYLPSRCHQILKDTTIHTSTHTV